MTFDKKEYRLKNRERAKKYAKEYYLKNKEYAKKYAKEWCLKNKERKKEYDKKYRLENKEHIKEYAKEYAKEYNLKNKERIKKNMGEYRSKNRERAKEYSKEYRLKNIERIKEYVFKNRERVNKRRKEYRLKNIQRMREYENNRYKTDINFKLRKVCRGRIRLALKGKIKSASTMELIGCTIDELRSHIESQFKPWMMWENHGLWDIDHIKAMSSFDLSDPAQQHACCNWSNLQPMEHIENIRKGAKC